MSNRTLKDFVGQRQVIETLMIACASAKERREKLPHVLFFGPPGLGKTTVARVLADEMGGGFVSRIATAITKPEDVVDCFCEIKKINTVIFIDEAEQLSRPITELLHTALEGETLTVKLKKKTQLISLPEFTMVAATNYPGELPKPFLDRFLVKLRFVAYSDVDIYEILIRHAADPANGLFTEDALKMIASRSFGTPRVALSYMRQARDFATVKTKNRVVTSYCVAETFKLMGVDNAGLCSLDRDVLSVIAQYSRPIGVEAIAQLVNEDRSSVEMSENKLVRLGLITRTARGRLITPNGEIYDHKVRGLSPQENAT